MFTSQTSLKQIAEDSQIKAKIPAQFASEASADKLEKLVTVILIGATSVFASSFFANILLSVALSQLWGSLNAL